MGGHLGTQMCVVHAHISISTQGCKHTWAQAIYVYTEMHAHTPVNTGVLTNRSALASTHASLPGCCLGFLQLLSSGKAEQRGDWPEEGFIFGCEIVDTCLRSPSTEEEMERTSLMPWASSRCPAPAQTLHAAFVLLTGCLQYWRHSERERELCS